MKLLSEREKLEMKGRLMSAISKWMEDEVFDDVGYIPENLDTLMVNAAFGVIEAVNATNVVVDENS